MVVIIADKKKPKKIYRVVQKWHKVYGTIILQPYITETCSYQQNVLKNFLHDWSQCLNTAIKYFLVLPRANKLMKNIITFSMDLGP